MRLLEVACLGWKSITETFLASLEIWAFVWVACMGRACLALVITEMDRNDGSITEIFFLLDGAYIGWRSITEIVSLLEGYSSSPSIQ
jgi:hypothetical protein